MASQPSQPSHPLGTDSLIVSPPLSAPTICAGANSRTGQAAVVQLLRSLGKAYRLLSEYKCAEAVDAFSELPTQQYTTAWVLTQLGRAHFEMVDYQKACMFFEWSRNVDPYRLEGLEVYSTVLWHMKNEVRGAQRLVSQSISCWMIHPNKSNACYLTM